MSACNDFEQGAYPSENMKAIKENTMDYMIFSDSAADIAGETAAAADVRFFTMSYSVGSEMRICTKKEPPEEMAEFYNGQRKGDLTKTTMINPVTYIESASPYLKEGKSILYLSLSGGLSSTYDSARAAQQELEAKYPGQRFLPFDTLSATGGMGVLLERAIANRAKGMTIDENYNDLLEARSKLTVWFFVQDLEYLKRGGRVSSAAAVVGTMLGIKPVLIINGEGKLENVNKKRGLNSAVSLLADKYKELHDPDTETPVYIVDTDNTEGGDKLEQIISPEPRKAPIKRVSLSPIIGAHTGPELTALCFLRK